MVLSSYYVINSTRPGLFLSSSIGSVIGVFFLQWDKPLTSILWPFGFDGTCTLVYLWTFGLCRFIWSHSLSRLSHEWVTFYLVSSELVWTELLLLFDHKNNQDQNCCVYKYNYATLSSKPSNWSEFAGHAGTAAELLSALLLLALSCELSWSILNQNAKKD